YTRLERALILHKVQFVYGDYTWVYDLYFDTHERVTAVPKVPTADCFDYGGKLRHSPVRWAVVGFYDEVEREAKVVGASGTPQQYGQLWLLIADYPSQDAAGLLTALRASGI
ncbi:MAG: hypothetical protein WCE97_12755, partial [Candidatus Cybelea sp.]